MHSAKSKYNGAEVAWALLLGLVVGPIVYGIVLVKMWSWFVMPVFEVPTLSIPLAIGLGMVVRMLTGANNNATEKSEGSGDFLAKVISNQIAMPLITLFIAWVVTLFI